jgi:hypothetical protein
MSLLCILPPELVELALQFLNRDNSNCILRQVCKAFNGMVATPQRALSIHDFVKNVPLLAWARKNGAPWDREVCIRVVGMNQLEVIKWALEHDCPWYPVDCCLAAIANRNFAMLEWLRDSGKPWQSTVACSNAARAGNLEMLQWLRDNGCPWDSWTCTGAAAHNRFEVLKWAVANGCPWDDDVYYHAKNSGNAEMIKWVDERAWIQAVDGPE